jgi:SAM-dependent methyltransferase
LSAPWAEIPCSPEGIPILIAEREAYLEAVADDLESPLDAVGFEALCHLACYLPQLLAPNAPMRRAIRRALIDFLEQPSGLSVELGCSIGADLRTLAEVSRATIGVDLNMAALRAAHAHLSGLPVPLLERVEGRSFKTAAPIHLSAVEEVLLVAGNAMDPPLFAEVADVVLAVNLLDSVSSPLALLGQIDAILKPGGLLILTSPFAWKDSLTPPSEALGGGIVERFAELGSAACLRGLLEGRIETNIPFRYEILRTQDVPWTLRDHARAVTHYDVHVLVAKKLALPQVAGLRDPYLHAPVG